MRTKFADEVEKGRVMDGPFASTFHQQSGAFFIKIGEEAFQIIVSNNDGWEHASMCPVYKKRTPTWEEMSTLKEYFWEEEEAVVQYHPPKSSYINSHPYVLHLWRPLTQILPLPPSSMVGVKDSSPPTNEKEFDEIQHKARHILLHSMFDELLADYIAHHRSIEEVAFVLHQPINKLMEWSYEQTINPSEHDHETR